MKFILLILLYAGTLNAQVRQPSPHAGDEAKAGGLKMLVDSLGLTPSQSTALQKATDGFHADMQSLSAKNLTSQQRQAEIKNLLSLYHKELGQILTPAQMGKYRSIEHAQQQKLRAKWESRQRRGKVRFGEENQH